VQFETCQGDPEGQFMKVDVLALAPNGSNDSGLVSTNFKFIFESKRLVDQWYVDAHALGSLNDKPLDLGLRRRFMPNGRDFDFEVGVNHSFRRQEDRIKISPFIGFTGSRYDLTEEATQTSNGRDARLGNNKVGVRALWEMAGFDVSGTLTYFDSRVR
jgi:hypothetical protein